MAEDSFSRTSIWFRGSYALSSVFYSRESELRDEISDFWMNNQAVISSAEAERRAAEVVLAIRNLSGELVGVSTVYAATAQAGTQCYYYRMFIRPEDRVYKLAHFALLKTRDVLSAAADIEGKPETLVIIAENKKLMRKGMQKFFLDNGFSFAGYTQKGLGIWTSSLKAEQSD